MDRAVTFMLNNSNLIILLHFGTVVRSKPAPCVSKIGLRVPECASLIMLSSLVSELELRHRM